MKSPAEIIAEAVYAACSPTPIDAKDSAVAAISALAEAGYRIVPAAPSIAMCEAGALAFVRPEKKVADGADKWSVGQAFRAMLDAAPDAGGGNG